MHSRGVPLATIRQISKAAATRLRRVTLKDLAVSPMHNHYEDSDPGSLVDFARWLHGELKVRVAHQLMDYYRQPYMMMMCEPLAEVHSMHLTTFEVLSSFPRVESGNHVVELARALRQELAAQGSTLQLLREGIGELQSVLSSGESTLLQSFLDKFLVTKIGNHVLANNYVTQVERLTLRDRSQMAATAPAVVNSCKLSPLVTTVARDICALAQDVYGGCPEVIIDDDLDTEVLVIPGHLNFIFREVLKNAVVATVDSHPVTASLPSVQVAIHPGKYDVEVKVADHGGGMKRRVLKRIWEYGYSGPRTGTLEPVERAGRHLQMQMSGYGMGIPLSRLYARYFGGDLTIHSVYGFGTDVSIRLNRLGDHVELGCSVIDDAEDLDH